MFVPVVNLFVCSESHPCVAIVVNMSLCFVAFCEAGSYSAAQASLRCNCAALAALNNDSPTLASLVVGL